MRAIWVMAAAALALASCARKQDEAATIAQASAAMDGCEGMIGDWAVSPTDTLTIDKPGHLYILNAKDSAGEHKGVLECQAGALQKPSGNSTPAYTSASLGADKMTLTVDGKVYKPAASAQRAAGK